jgi:hypothetical protein
MGLWGDAHTNGQLLNPERVLRTLQSAECGATSVERDITPSSRTESKIVFVHFICTLKNFNKLTLVFIGTLAYFYTSCFDFSVHLSDPAFCHLVGFTRELDIQISYF